MLQVMAEGMVLRHEVRLDDVLQILLIDALLCIEFIPQRIFFTVVQVYVAVRHATVLAEDGQQPLLVLLQHRSLRQPVNFRPTLHLVIAQQHSVFKHRLDLLRCGKRLLPRFLMLLLVSFFAFWFFILHSSFLIFYSINRKVNKI